MKKRPAETPVFFVSGALFMAADARARPLRFTQIGGDMQLRLAFYIGALVLLTAPAFARAIPYEIAFAGSHLLLAQSSDDADDGEATEDPGAGTDEADEYSAFPENFQFPRIPVTFPASADAPGLTDFLTSLRTTVEKRDEAGLIATVAPKIFWDRDFGGNFDENASGEANFRNAMQIGITDILPEYVDDGWKRLALLLVPGKFSTEADFPGAYCTPVFPALTDAAAAEPTFAKVDMGEEGWRLQWGYVEGKAEARDKPAADGVVVATVENEAVPVYSWGIEENIEWVDVGLPDGRRAFVDTRQVGSWVNERLCFGKSGDKWSITGYIGGGD